MGKKQVTLIETNLDGKYLHFQGNSELYLEQGFIPWWYENDKRPEYNKAYRDLFPDRVETGNASLHWFTMFASCTSGVYIPLTLHSVYGEIHAKASVMVFSRNDSDDFHRSTGRLYVRIGINPYGDESPLSQRTIWSKPIAPYDWFKNISVSTFVKSDICTVWLWSQSEWAFKHNDIWLDKLHVWEEYEEIGIEPPGSGHEDIKATINALISGFDYMSARLNKILATLDDRNLPK